jgi:hypothetical protein
MPQDTKESPLHGNGRVGGCQSKGGDLAPPNGLARQRDYSGGRVLQ